MGKLILELQISESNTEPLTSEAWTIEYLSSLHKERIEVEADTFLVSCRAKVAILFEMYYYIIISQALKTNRFIFFF